MNKNDLRFQKTEIAIRNAYLALKKRASSTVKVKELCQKAMINKTTFYAHYETMECLHKQICNEYVADMLSQCKSIDKIDTNAREFVYSIHHIFLENASRSEKLYGTELSALIDDVERILIEMYSEKIKNEETELAIRFCIGGAFRLLVMEQDPDRIEKTVKLVEKIFD